MIDVRAELRRLADPEYNEFSRKINPGIRFSYGVRVPLLRDLAKRILEDDWRAFLAVPTECFEEDMLRALVISRCRAPMEEKLPLVEDFVPTIDNWAVNDIFTAKWRMTQHDAGIMWDYCVSQLDSGEEFRMRFAVTMLMSNYLDADHIDGILGMVVSHDNPGYYYRMGAAWCLSFCFIKFPEATEKAMFSGSLERWTLEKTVSKIRDSYRVPKGEKDRLKARLKES